MRQSNPYLASGIFAGEAYVHRNADTTLLSEIHKNARFPYFAAPRQSGKSSLIARTRRLLEGSRLLHVLVDVSTFVPGTFEDFWQRLLEKVAQEGHLRVDQIDSEQPQDTFTTWIETLDRRLVVFIDEVDHLIRFESCEQIFAVFRSMANNRAIDPRLNRLQFVFSGAAHPDRMITDPNISPFNVAVQISIEHMTQPQLVKMAEPFDQSGAYVSTAAVDRIFALTGGSVFLSHLMFEHLWTLAISGATTIEPWHVDKVADAIVADSHLETHFKNIARLVMDDPRNAALLQRRVVGKLLTHSEEAEFALTGLAATGPILWNILYTRVFGPGGPLDLRFPPESAHELMVPSLPYASSTRRSLLAGPPQATARDAATTARPNAHLRWIGKISQHIGLVALGAVLMLIGERQEAPSLAIRYDPDPPMAKIPREVVLPQIPDPTTTTPDAFTTEVETQEPEFIGPLPLPIPSEVEKSTPTPTKREILRRCEKDVALITESDAKMLDGPDARTQRCLSKYWERRKSTSRGAAENDAREKLAMHRFRLFQALRDREYSRKTFDRKLSTEVLSAAREAWDSAVSNRPYIKAEWKKYCTFLIGQGEPNAPPPSGCVLP